MIKVLLSRLLVLDALKGRMYALDDDDKLSTLRSLTNTVTPGRHRLPLPSATLGGTSCVGNESKSGQWRVRPDGGQAKMKQNQKSSACLPASAKSGKEQIRAEEEYR